MKKVYCYTNEASEAVANYGGAMEADTISKNGRSQKSQMSMGNNIRFMSTGLQTIFIFAFTAITLIGCAFSKPVTISVTPSTATISQNNNVLGNGTYSTSIAPKSYKSFSISADGYDTQTATIYYSDNKSSYQYTLVPNRRTIHISVNPDNANIKIDGNIVGTGSYTFALPKGNYQDMQLSASGYLPKQVRVKYSDNQDSYNFNMEEDQAFLSSVSGTDIANKKMKINVKEGVSREQALKTLKFYITNNFETLEVNDNMAGWVRTAWVSTKFNSTSVRTVRTRVEIKEVPDDGSGTLGFNFYIASQFATERCGTNEECFQDWDRILKKYATLYADMQNSVN
jgi:hypothetical protein